MAKTKRKRGSGAISGDQSDPVVDQALELLLRARFLLANKSRPAARIIWALEGALRAKDKGVLGRFERAAFPKEGTGRPVTDDVAAAATLEKMVATFRAQKVDHARIVARLVESVANLLMFDTKQIDRVALAASIDSTAEPQAVVRAVFRAAGYARPDNLFNSSVKSRSRGARARQRSRSPDNS